MKTAPLLLICLLANSLIVNAMDIPTEKGKELAERLARDPDALVNPEELTILEQEADAAMERMNTQHSTNEFLSADGFRITFFAASEKPDSPEWQEARSKFATVVGEIKECRTEEDRAKQIARSIVALLHLYASETPIQQGIMVQSIVIPKGVKDAQAALRAHREENQEQE